ncbi:MAG: hypothetical protein R3178_11460, partial [Rhodothermales bacterium]|nr:hypothetical protein [Rhodothermales bacterium]
MNRLFLISILTFCFAVPLRAQTQVPPRSNGVPGADVRSTAAVDRWETPPADNAVYYAMQRTVVFADPDSTQPYVEISAREPVEMLRGTTDWAEILTRKGARGFVPRSAITNLWIRVSKQSKTVWLHEGADVALTLPADMAYNFFLDKEQRGSTVEADHWRTPEGLYFVVAKNDQSRFYKALVLNYPSGDDARRGLAEGRITEHQYFAILEADQKRQTPPMDTPLGGWIEIH